MLCAVRIGPEKASALTHPWLNKGKPADASEGISSASKFDLCNEASTHMILELSCSLSTRYPKLFGVVW